MRDRSIFLWRIFVFGWSSIVRKWRLGLSMMLVRQTVTVASEMPRPRRSGVGSAMSVALATITMVGWGGSGVAVAVDRDWSDAGADNRWTTVENWVGNTLPLPDDFVNIDLSQVDVTVDFQPDSTFVVIDGLFSSETININSGELRVKGTIPSASLILNGTMNVNAGGTFTNAGEALFIESTLNLNGGTINVSETNSILAIEGAFDSNDNAVRANLNIISGDIMTGVFPAESALAGQARPIFLTHTKLDIASGYTNAISLTALGPVNQLAGTIQTGQTLRLLGTTGNELGGIEILADTDLTGTVILDSLATSAVGSPSRFPGSFLAVGTHKLTNSGTIKVEGISVNVGGVDSERGLREINGSGTFENVGAIENTTALPLSISGLTNDQGTPEDQTDDTFDRITVNLKGGSIDGTLAFTHAEVAIDNNSGVAFTKPLNLKMLGSDNQIDAIGNLATDQTVTVEGTDATGFGVLAFKQDFVSDGTVVLQSTSVIPDENDRLAGAAISLGEFVNTDANNDQEAFDIDQHRDLTNNHVIEIQSTLQGSGDPSPGQPFQSVREINGVGTFTNMGDIKNTSGLALSFNGVQRLTESGDKVSLGKDGNGDDIFVFDPIQVNLNSGEIEGPVQFSHSKVKIENAVTGAPGEDLDLIMLGTDNELDAELTVGRRLTLQGTRALDAGFGGVTLVSDTTTTHTVAGTIVMDSKSRTPSTGSTDVVKGSILSLGDHTLTLAGTGKIEANFGDGGVREIQAKDGTLAIDGGEIAVETDVTLLITGVSEPITDSDDVTLHPIAVELNTGSITGGGEVGFSHSEVTIGSGFGPAELVMFGFNNKIEAESGSLNADQNIAIRATNPEQSSGGLMGLLGNLTSAGTIMLDSIVTEVDSDTGRFPGSTLDVGDFALTNTGTLAVKAGNIINQTTGDRENGIRQITGSNLGTFINEGVIDIESDQILQINGKSEQVSQGFDPNTGDEIFAIVFSPINVALNSGSINGRVAFSNSNVTIGSGFAAPTDFVMLGFNNKLKADSGSLLAGQDITIRASDDFGFGVLGLLDDLTAAGAIVLDSVATKVDSDTNRFPGASLDVGDFTLTNTGTILITSRNSLPLGAIETGVREITGTDNGTFINNGVINIEDNQFLRLNGKSVPVLDGGGNTIAIDLFPVNINLSGGTINYLGSNSNITISNANLIVSDAMGGDFAPIMLGFNNKISGSLKSGHRIEIKGTDSTGFGVVALQGDFTSQGTIVIDSDAQIKDTTGSPGIPPTNRRPGAVMNVTKGFTFTNFGLIQVDATNDGVREISGAGTFVSEAGSSVVVAANQSLLLTGIPIRETPGDETSDIIGFDPISVILKGGTFSGKTGFAHSVIELDPNFTGSVDFEFLGFNNKIGGRFNATNSNFDMGHIKTGQTFTAVGDDINAFGIIALQADVEIDNGAEVVLDSRATKIFDPLDGTPAINVPGSLVDVTTHTLTNNGTLWVQARYDTDVSPSERTDMDMLSGSPVLGRRQIIGQGTFINHGDILIRTLDENGSIIAVADSDKPVLEIAGIANVDENGVFDPQTPFFRIRAEFEGGLIEPLVVFSHSEVKFGANFTAPANFEFQGFDNVIVFDSDKLKAGQQLTAMGTDENVFGNLQITGDFASEGTIVLDSKATKLPDPTTDVPDPTNVPGSLLTLGDDATLTNRGLIHVKSGSDVDVTTAEGIVKGIRRIEVTDTAAKIIGSDPNDITFINEGDIVVDAGMTLSVAGKLKQVFNSETNQFDTQINPITVKLNSGTIDGNVSFSQSIIEFGTGFTDAVTLEFQGFNNVIAATSDKLKAGQQLTILGTDGNLENAFGIVTLGGDFTSEGDIILDSTADRIPDPSGGVTPKAIPGAVIDVRTFEFINKGTILAKARFDGDGKLIDSPREIKNLPPEVGGPEGTFVNASDGNIMVEAGTSLTFSGSTTLFGGQTFLHRIFVELGGTVEGKTSYTVADLTIASDMQGNSLLTGNAEFEMLGVSNKFGGPIAAGQTLTLLGTNASEDTSNPDVGAFGGSVVVLTSELRSAGTVVLASAATKRNRNVFPGATLNIATHQYINSGTLHIKGDEGSRIITGTGSLTNEGQITIDAGVSLNLTDQVDLLLTDTSVVQMHIRGIADVDLITVTEPTKFDGELNLLIDDPGSINFGDIFTVFEFDNRLDPDTSEETFFDRIVGVDVTGDIYLAPIWGDDSLTLRATLVGDANFDGTVSPADLFVLLANLDVTGGWEDGDFNGDRMISPADLFLLLAHLDQSETDFLNSPSLANSPELNAILTPEPGTLGLLGLASMMLLSCRRKVG